MGFELNAGTTLWYGTSGKGTEFGVVDNSTAGGGLGQRFGSEFMVEFLLDTMGLMRPSDISGGVHVRAKYRTKP